MKGRVSTLVRKALRDEDTRTILRKVIAEGVDATINIDGEEYRVVSTNSKNDREEKNKNRLQPA